MTEREWPIFEIGPLLEAYGGEPCEEDSGWRKYACVFHGDRTPSASVNTTLQVFVCHQCGVKGNAVQCIMKYEGKSYKDALKRAEEVTRKGNNNVPRTRGGSRSVPGSARHQSGSRTFSRNWRRP